MVHPHRAPRFGSEQIITFVAMATPDDLNANAEFIRLADSFVEVPGAVWEKSGGLSVGHTKKAAL